MKVQLAGEIMAVFQGYNLFSKSVTTSTHTLMEQSRAFPLTPSDWLHRMRPREFSKAEKRGKMLLLQLYFLA